MKTLALAVFVALLAGGEAIPVAEPLPCDQGDGWLSEEWDAIVVGAGTAGIIVADRLSEGGKKTLLLELGGPSYGITGGTERPDWLDGTNLSRVDVPGLCEYHARRRYGERSLLISSCETRHEHLLPEHQLDMRL